MWRVNRRNIACLTFGALVGLSACNAGNLSGRGVDARDVGGLEDDAALDAGDVGGVQGVEDVGDSGDAWDASEADAEGGADASDAEEAPDAGNVPDVSEEPVWACEGAPDCDAVNVTTTLGQMRGLNGCAFELALEDSMADGEALADRLLARVTGEGGGQARTMVDVLGALNRQGRAGVRSATETRLSGLGAAGFRWNTGDDDVSYWYPQGITGSSDADASGLVQGRRLIMTSWYHKTDARPTKGARISVADITDLSDVRYRHLLLVDPVEEGGQVDFESASYDSGNALHAGGIVWWGRYLYVVDTVQGLRIYDLGRMFRPSHTDNTEAIGISGGRSDAHGYLFAVPRIARYRLTSESCRVRFAFVGLDRQSDPPALVTGEYFSDHAQGKMVVWPLDADTGLLETRQGSTFASEGLVVGQTRAQGGTRVGGDFYVSSSSQDGSEGRLYKGRPGGQNTSVNWVYGAEDLYYERAHDRIWTAAEHPGARDVVSIERF
ncbi:hypothetical protein FRC98_20120 [Lujinxingia vulgaris]|uniref:Secreted protein n=1 Tax=Lujinxingia vulgaris TaxID=2600176 RepID=A0A5C6X7A2_9DELT|nr:hypothetical protein [Lujinxingia vulgaris]TXD33905.1 hypothetical protein FRC98_20120 [Lujinxingia vulgaris]